MTRRRRQGGAVQQVECQQLPHNLKAPPGFTTPEPIQVKINRFQAYQAFAFNKCNSMCTATSRVVLVVDLWHPELAAPDRAALGVLYPPGM
jgi:hypothetical protein